MPPSPQPAKTAQLLRVPLLLMPRLVSFLYLQLGSWCSQEDPVVAYEMHAASSCASGATCCAWSCAGKLPSTAEKPVAVK